jgi:pyrroline-5-carboxylate reductase
VPSSARVNNHFPLSHSIFVRFSLPLFSIKPCHIDDVFSDKTLEKALSGKLVISLLTGITCQRLNSLMPASRIVRAMPNITCSVQAGMTVICGSATSTEEDVIFSQYLFSCLGWCAILDESLFDIAAAVGGSGPAFFL